MSSPIRAMLTLSFGTAVAKLCVLLSMPVLTRIYTPAHFSYYSLFTSIVVVAAPLMTLRYSLAIPLARRDEVAFNLSVFCLFLVAVSSIILSVILSFLWPTLIQGVVAADGSLLWQVVVAGCVASAVYEVLAMWASRKQAYSSSARSQVLSAVVGESGKVSSGLAGAQGIGLVAGHILGQIVSSLMLIRVFGPEFWRLSGTISQSKMSFTASYYRDFLIWRMPSQLLQGLAFRGPVFYFATVFGSNATGYLGLAMMALSLPITLIANNAGNALYAEAARMGRRARSEIREIAKDTVKKLSILSFVPGVALMLSGPALFSFIFGKEWEVAGEFASIMSVSLIFQFVASPITKLLNIFGDQKLIFYLDAQRTIIVISVFLVSYYKDLDPRQVLYIFSGAIALHYLVALFVVFRALRVPVHNRSKS